MINHVDFTHTTLKHAFSVFYTLIKHGFSTNHSICRDLAVFITAITVNKYTQLLKGVKHISQSLFLEETRVPCVKAGLISAILSNLESDDPNIVLQALRAIGNISFDNGR